MNSDGTHKQIRLAAAGLTVALVLMTAACSNQPKRDFDDEDFAPTMPPDAEMDNRASGTIYHAGSGGSLVEDRRARRQGDVLTIELVERTEASKNSSTSTSRNSQADIEGPTLFGRGVTSGGTEILSGGMDSDQSFEGQGDAQQSNHLEGEITVTVARQLPNGNLVVQGEKWLTLNQGEERVRIAGIIRPEDIGPDNNVPSNRVADARIAYSGSGTLDDASTPGWLARFFQSPLTPF